MNAAPPVPEPALTHGLRRHRLLLTFLLLMLAAWILYAPTVRYGFVYYDDIRILRDHPELYGQPTMAGDLRAIFATYFPREEPLLVRDVVWAVESRLFGFGNPVGYHLGNVLLHGVVVALMFVFLMETTRRYRFALAVSIAYLLLAMHTEPVAWIMGSKDLLSALFMLLALCAQTRRLTSASHWGRWGWYGTTLACFVVALFSKISVLTFPFVLFLHAVFFPFLTGARPANAALPWGRSVVKEAGLFLPGLMVSLLVYHWYRQTLSQMGILDRGYNAHGLAHLWNLLMVDPLVFWEYLQQAFLPWHLQVLYTWPDLKAVYPVWQILVSFATLALLGGAGVWLFRRRKDLFFYFGAFFLFMVPYLNLMYMGIWVAERYLYFSSFCLLAIALSIAGEVVRRPKSAMRAGVLVGGAGFVAMNLFQTFWYQPAWRNGETLWQYHLELPQTNPAAYANLAAYYYAEAAAHPGTVKMAIAMNKMSLVVEAGLTQFWPDRGQSPPPETYFLFFLRSIVEEVKDEPEAALTSLLTADRLRPRFDSTEFNLSRLYHKLAGAAVDPVQRGIYARAARDRFVEYLSLTYRGRPAPPDVQKELADLEAACRPGGESANPGK